MEIFLYASFYIFITVGYLLSAAGGILGCICFTGFILLGLILFVAPELGFIICLVIYLAWAMDK